MQKRLKWHGASWRSSTDLPGQLCLVLILVFVVLVVALLLASAKAVVVSMALFVDCDQTLHLVPLTLELNNDLVFLRQLLVLVQALVAVVAAHAPAGMIKIEVAVERLQGGPFAATGTRFPARVRLVRPWATSYAVRCPRPHFCSWRPRVSRYGYPYPYGCTAVL
jgi:hypothetical protein